MRLGKPARDGQSPRIKLDGSKPDIVHPKSVLVGPEYLRCDLNRMQVSPQLYLLPRDLRVSRVLNPRDDGPDSMRSVKALAPKQGCRPDGG